LINTSIGAFNGPSWEALMQLVLKKKYAAEGYQHVPASGGDFGIEGFTRETGHAFQCYCPDFHYERKELYAHQRKKITTDLNSLRNYATGLQSILGDTRIKNWYLITPDVINKDLIVHAVNKQNEVRDWGLPHLHEEFTVYVHDAGYYMNEINEVRQIEGVPITIARETLKIPELNDEKTDYEGNLERKTKLRIGDKGEAAFEGLLKLTRRAFLDHDPFFHQLYNSHPHTYWQVVPRPLTSGSKAEGRFGKQDFIYLAASDEYRCPAGQLLTRRHSSMDDGMLLHCYHFSGCQSCSMQKQCTTGKERRVKRWEHEAVVDACMFV
jgi:hypothetical protein